MLLFSIILKEVGFYFFYQLLYFMASFLASHTCTVYIIAPLGMLLESYLLTFACKLFYKLLFALNEFSKTPL